MASNHPHPAVTFSTLTNSAFLTNVGNAVSEPKDVHNDTFVNLPLLLALPAMLFNKSEYQLSAWAIQEWTK